MPNYEGILGLVENEGAHTVYVRPSSVPVILAVLAEAHNRAAWDTDEIGGLTDAQYDTIDEWMSGAAYDMMQNEQIGQLFWTIADTLPIFCLELDGDTYAKVDFPSLYEKLPSAWKTATEFTLPDWRGKMPIFAGGGFTVYDIGGETDHTLTGNEMPAHSHIYTPPTLNLDFEAPGAPDLLAAGIGIATSTSSVGGGAAHNNMPPYIALKVGVIAW